jgi:hypothetical protein
VTVETPAFPADERTESTAVSSLDSTASRSTTNSRRDNNTPAVPVDLVDDLVQPRPQYTNLARGIVWADVVADIAADEEARQSHGDTDHQLPEAA